MAAVFVDRYKPLSRKRNTPLWRMFFRNRSVTFASSTVHVAGEHTPTITTQGERLFTSTKRLATNGLMALATAGALALAGTGPASAASAGPQTGWEYSGEGGVGCGIGLPQAGFELPNDRFVLTSSGPFANVMTITIGASVAAPQGAAPGECGDNSDPVVPAPIDITDVDITGTGACSDGSGTFLRINSTVAFNFTCGASTYAIAGNMNICAIPIGPFTSVPNPECAADPDASGHLVTTYVGT